MQHLIFVDVSATLRIELVLGSYQGWSQWSCPVVFEIFSTKTSVSKVNEDQEYPVQKSISSPGGVSNAVCRCGEAFSPTTINTGKGTEFEGAIVALPSPHDVRQTQKHRSEGLFQNWYVVLYGFVWCIYRIIYIDIYSL